MQYGRIGSAKPRKTINRHAKHRRCGVGCKRLNQAGGLTLECAVVMPIVLVLIVALVWLGQLAAASMLLTRTVREAADGLARVWPIDRAEAYGESMHAGDISAGSVGRRQKYWWIGSLLFSGIKEDAAEAAIARELRGRINLPRGLEPDCDAMIIDVDWTPGAAGGSIGVKASIPVRTPASAIGTLFGKDGMLMLEANASSSVRDPRAFIDQTDFLVQAALETEAGGSFVRRIILPLNRALAAVTGKETE